MPLSTANNKPGFSALSQSEEVQVWFPAKGDANHILEHPCRLDATVTDAGNTPTSTIRGGNLLARKPADAMDYVYDPDAADGTQEVIGVLEQHHSMIGEDGSAADQHLRMLRRADLKLAAILNEDYQALAQLARLGFKFDDPSLDGAAFLVHPRGVWTKAADYTVTAADNGRLFIATAAVNFTLPTIAAGLSFDFLQSANANMVITGAANSILSADATNTLATTLTFSTADQKLGARVRVTAVYIAANTLAWAVEVLTNHTMTAA